MEILDCFLLLLAFVVLMVCVVFDMVKIWKIRNREELRRETIKNSLQEIVIKLDDISKGIWYEK